MPLIWYMVKTFTFDVKYTYRLLSVEVLQSKGETNGFCKFNFFKRKAKEIMTVTKL